MTGFALELVAWEKRAGDMVYMVPGADLFKCASSWRGER